jgi:ABC-type cobalamin/Fe3+-siderophores transport system ATPase subunit
MRVLIIGPRCTGKTTLLHKILRTNAHINFPIIIDDIQSIQEHQKILAGIPVDNSFIITSQTIDSIPSHARTGALILTVPDFRAY